MVYKFAGFKNIEVHGGRIIMIRHADGCTSTSVGYLHDHETIEQALAKIGVDFDTVYPDFIRLD